MGANQNDKDKSDKETQSSMQRIFKELIERENRNPEKEGLLKTKQNEINKCRQSKATTASRSCDSSNSERKRVRTHQYNAEVTRECLARKDHRSRVAVEQRTPADRGGTGFTQSERSNKKETWWFRKDNKKSEDSMSKYSCVLMKILKSDYSGMSFLLLLFMTSCAVAFLVIFKTVSAAGAPAPGRGCERLGPGLPEASVLPDSENFRRRLEALNRKDDRGLKTGSREDDSELSGYRINRKYWDDSEARDVAGLVGYDSSPDALQGLTNAEGDAKEFNRLLEASRSNVEKGTNNMKNFYKKFIETESLIRNLKKNTNEPNSEGTRPYNGDERFDYDNFNRAKRSLKFLRRRRNNDSFDKDNRQNKPKTNVNLYTNALFRLPHTFNLNRNEHIKITKNKDEKATKGHRDKRKSNFTSYNNIPGFLIEKKKFLIQFDKQDGQDGVRKSNIIPKCSHSPYQYKYHEKEMKHPFYKNTQRLDDLLDKLLDAKLPELMTDPFALELLLNRDAEAKQTTKVNAQAIDSVTQAHHANTQTVDDKYFKLLHKINHDKTTTNWPDLNYQHERDKTKSANRGQESARKIENAHKMKVTNDIYTRDLEAFGETSGTTPAVVAISNANLADTTAVFDQLLSKLNIPILSYPLSQRRLLQANDGDEGEGLQYSDDLENSGVEEALDRSSKSVKRAVDKEAGTTGLDDINEKLTNFDNIKIETPSVHNPNWKGAMPLYPDELNSMIKQAALKHIYKNVHMPPTEDLEATLKTFTDSSLESEKMDSEIGDVEYMEDYMNKRYQRFVKMAQAYSDYGVLDEKKDSTQKHQGMDDNKMQDEQNRVNLIVKDDGQPSLKESPLFGRLIKGFTFDVNDVNAKEGIKFEIRPSPVTKALVEKFIKYVPDSVYKSSTNGWISKETNTNQSVVNHKPVDRKTQLDDIDYINVKSRSLLTINKADHAGDQFNGSSYFRQSLPKTSVDITGTNIIDKNDDKSHLEKSLNNKNIYKQANIYKFMSKFFKSMMSSIYGPNTWQRNCSNIDTSEKGNEIRTVNRENFNRTQENTKLNDIVYKSRLLLAIDEPNTTLNMEDKLTTKAKNTDKISNTSMDFNHNSQTGQMGVNTTEINQNKSMWIHNDEKLNNKTVVKRDVNNDNSVFWNDIYDDEYGINIDPLKDITLDRVRLSPKPRAPVNKTRVWFRNNMDKLKRNMDKLHNKNKTKVHRTHSKSYMKPPIKTMQHRQTPIYYFRQRRETTKNSEKVKTDEEITEEKCKEKCPQKSQETNFALLTSNMKEVLKDAIKAVNETKHSPLKECKGKDTVTSSLMQQVIRLMADVVDYQVQQKTCRKLPPDLHAFLLWLTSPHDETNPPSPFSFGEPDYFVARVQENDHQKNKLKAGETERVMNLISTPSKGKDEIEANTRSECIGTLNAVHSLLDQYDHMTDDEKNKMSGMKDYLLTQLEFLNGRLAGLYSMESPLMEDGDAYERRHKRDTLRDNKRRDGNVKRRDKRITHKFIKSIANKKHTKSTVSSFEGAQLSTEGMKGRGVVAKKLLN